MKFVRKLPLISARCFAAGAVIAGAALSASAITIGGNDGGVALHGSVQFTGLFPEDDEAIGTEHSTHPLLFNSYADLNMISKYVDAGIRLEFMKWPLPGFDPDFKGWGVPHVYVKGRVKGFELTGGTFYEQFGSGFILRTYEERSLGIDNSILGGRVKWNGVQGITITALGGLQRCYWDWKKKSQVYGAHATVEISTLAPSLSKRGISWTAGVSYVLKHEDEQDVFIPGSDMRLNLPTNVSAFDLRSELRKGAWGVMAEAAWKGQDPSFDNNYTYGHGSAYMLSASYSRSGMSALIQAKRSENMAYRSQRMASGTAAFLNNMPAFAYLHTYSLPALYPYATQAAPGEWAFQGSFAYTFKRRTPLGGKYGTKVKINASYIRGLDRKLDAPLLDGSNVLYGTDWGSTSFFGMGKEFYHDFNIQIDKKWSASVSQLFMYMNQNYNKTVVEGKGGLIHANIFVVDTKWRMNRRLTLRNELQYLHTRQDQKDWAYGLLELSIAPYLMISISDMWNCGDTGTHYYMGGVAGTYRANRLMLSYGRTRAGFDCSGGVCRYVPASRGVNLTYVYNF